MCDIDYRVHFCFFHFNDEFIQHFIVRFFKDHIILKRLNLLKYLKKCYRLVLNYNFYITIKFAYLLN